MIFNTNGVRFKDFWVVVDFCDCNSVNILGTLTISLPGKIKVISTCIWDNKRGRWKGLWNRKIQICKYSNRKNKDAFVAYSDFMSRKKFNYKIWVFGAAHCSYKCKKERNAWQYKTAENMCLLKYDYYIHVLKCYKFLYYWIDNENDITL